MERLHTREAKPVLPTLEEAPRHQERRHALSLLLEQGPWIRKNGNVSGVKHYSLMVWSLRGEKSPRFESLILSALFYPREFSARCTVPKTKCYLQPSACQDTSLIHRKRLFFWGRDVQEHVDRAEVVVWGLDPVHSTQSWGLALSDTQSQP